MSLENEYEIIKPERYLECLSCPEVDRQIQIADEREYVAPGWPIRFDLKCDGKERATIEVVSTVYFHSDESEFDYPPIFEDVDCPRFFPSD